MEAARWWAERQHGVVARRQLYADGVPEHLVRRELRSGRWQATGPLTVAVHNGPLSAAARRAVAVLETGPRAALAGVSALEECGFTLSDRMTHVIVPRGADPPRLPGVRAHESRRFREEDLLVNGLRREQQAVAVVHSVLWARSDRQALLYLTAAVQQRLVGADDLAAAAATVRRHRRRRLLLQGIADATGGSHSLGELDVLRALRRRGLPEPERQALRTGSDGNQYLDVDFRRYRVVLEIDGRQHEQPQAQVADALRDLALSADGDVVVRLTLFVWRTAEAQVLDALERLLVSRGWRRPAA